MAHIVLHALAILPAVFGQVTRCIVEELVSSIVPTPSRQADYSTAAADRRREPRLALAFDG